MLRRGPRLPWLAPPQQPRLLVLELPPPQQPRFLVVPLPLVQGLLRGMLEVTEGLDEESDDDDDMEVEEGV